jgi:hypothetical protein
LTLENKKSFNTGEPENSGFSNTQFKKYCSPVRLDSKNLGRNLKSTLFGGKGGNALRACGNAVASKERSSSNSEYRMGIIIGPPCKVPLAYEPCVMSGNGSGVRLRFARYTSKLHKRLSPSCPIRRRGHRSSRFLPIVLWWL